MLSKCLSTAPCSVNIKRGRISYNGRKLWIADLKPNRVLHGERVLFYCKNKVQKCGYPVASTCNDGTLTLPECFEGKCQSANSRYPWSPRVIPKGKSKGSCYLKHDTGLRMIGLLMYQFTITSTAFQRAAAASNVTLVLR